MIKFLVILVFLLNIIEQTCTAPQDRGSNLQRPNAPMIPEDGVGTTETFRPAVFENAGRILDSHSLGPKLPGKLAHKIVDTAVAPVYVAAERAQENGQSMVGRVPMVPSTFEADIDI